MKREKALKIVTSAIKETKKGMDIEITEDTDLIMDLSFDSLSFFMLFINLEVRFGKRIPERKMRSLGTVGDIVDALM